MTSEYLRRPLQWPWPARAGHAGIPLGNGTFGALLWGSGARLKITINRADYWDHHGGIELTEEASFANLKRLLAQGDEAELRRIFEGRSSPDETVLRPTRLPMGRVDLSFPDDAVHNAGLSLESGEACVAIGDVAMSAMVLRDEPALCIRLKGEGAGRVEVAGVPVDAPEVLGHLRKLGYPEVERLDHGWLQERPDEPTMVVAWRRVERGPQCVELFVCSVYGGREDAEELLDCLADTGYDALNDEAAEWWRGYWARGCTIDVPNETLMLLYYLGLYKLAGLSVPGGPAATLQGPWIEEHRLPPWSGDYHFNINVQECYWPAYAANHLEALEPLFELLKSWEPKLRRNAKVFASVDDGFLLPHAVDDRCTCMGGFWTGAVDHGSTAWTGQLLWLYYRYSMDERFLRETAYPFMKGALRVYEAMLEEDEDGRLCLPIGVSPEFGGANFDAYGKNASFQLAIIHFLCRKVVRASEILGVDELDRDAWREIDERLPLAATSADGAQILLWDGQALSESHRHHSHLAGVYPFDVFDVHGCDAERRLVASSMGHLTRMGMGAWSGWCVPWASILFGRTGHPDMAELLLEIFRRTFMNEGYGSLHDARFPGFTALCGRPDIMQIEAAMAASAAVLEMLVQCAHDEVRVFAAVPESWKDVTFSGLRTEGAFLISGEKRDGRVRSVTVESEAGGTLRLANPFGDGGAIAKRGDEETGIPLSGSVFEIEMEPRDAVTLVPV